MDRNDYLNRKLLALADPTRRTIMHRLCGREMRAGHLTRGFGMSRPAVSQHLRVLREAGLVTVRSAGTKRIYAVAPSALDDVMAFFDRLWSKGLRQLKAAAEAEQRTTRNRPRTPNGKRTSD